MTQLQTIVADTDDESPYASLAEDPTYDLERDFRFYPRSCRSVYSARPRSGLSQAARAILSTAVRRSKPSLGWPAETF